MAEGNSKKPSTPARKSNRAASRARNAKRVERRRKEQNARQAANVDYIAEHVGVPAAGVHKRPSKRARQIRRQLARFRASVELVA